MNTPNTRHQASLSLAKRQFASMVNSREAISREELNLTGRHLSRMVEAVAVNKLWRNSFRGCNPTAQAPSTLAEINAFMERRVTEAFYPVFDGGTDRTIYTTKGDNYLFRAWHDLTHYQEQAQFDFNGESVVAGCQLTALALSISHASAAAAKAGVFKRCLELFAVDTIGQAYLSTHYKDSRTREDYFTNDQFNFAWKVLNHGLLFACDSEQNATRK